MVLFIISGLAAMIVVQPDNTLRKSSPFWEFIAADPKMIARALKGFRDDDFENVHMRNPNAVAQYKRSGSSWPDELSAAADWIEGPGSSQVLERLEKIQRLLVSGEMVVAEALLQALVPGALQNVSRSSWIEGRAWALTFRGRILGSGAQSCLKATNDALRYAVQGGEAPDPERPPVAIFRTEDGYTLYYVNGEWIDSLDPDSQDMAWDGDRKGPVDNQGGRLPGRLGEASGSWLAGGQYGRLRLYKAVAAKLVAEVLIKEGDPRSRQIIEHDYLEWINQMTS